jgi:aspartate/methionine/tyrosine aminotransferase
MVMSLLDKGDEIVVLTPNYLQIYGWARALGVVVKVVEHDGDNDWQPDLDALDAAVTPATKLITICHPNNPTGAVLNGESMRRVVEIAARHGAYLHADEVYKGSELDGPECESFRDLYDNAIVTNGLSKAMALPGLRIGWLAGRADDIYTAWQRKDYTSITTSAISEYVAERVLKPELRSKILQRSKTILNENLALLADWIEANSDHVSLIPPKAGGMAFVRYHFEANSTELVHRLRDEKRVLLLPGDVYGMDGFFRVGIGSPRSHLEPGLERISDYIRANY